MGYRYIGSKERLAQEIIDVIQTQCPQAKTVIDLMAGTGLFSLALRKRGYRVLASDMMTYSVHHLRVNLLLNSSPSFDKLENIKGENRYHAVIAYLNSLSPINGFFTKEFSPAGSPSNGVSPRKYFSSNNASKIDAIRKQIKEWWDTKQLTEIEHSLLLHDLIMATNDVANIAGTYGHFLSHFVGRANAPILLEPSAFEYNDNIDGHEVRQGFAEDIASCLDADVCYIDPPYIKRQYAANYHILETIAREDEPAAVGESGLRPWRDQYSFFCSKVHIRESLEKIIKGLKSCDIYISYSEDGLLSIDEMTSFLSNFGIVSVREIEYKRFKSNNWKQKGSSITEYLIHLKKKQA